MRLFSVKYKSHSDETLMTLIQQGKTAALEELYIRYAKKIHYFLYKMLYNDAMTADDLLQDLFIKILEKPHLFHSERKFSTWAYTLATNLCKNEYRRKGIRNEASIDLNDISFHYEQETASVAYDITLFRTGFEKEINSLEENHRTTFLLRHIDELSIKEISEIMNCAEGTVKSRLFYTVKKLAYQLKDFNPQTI